MALKKIGYYVKKGKCLRVYETKKLNKRTKKMVKKRVNYAGKVLKKGTKVYKSKRECMKYLKKTKPSSKAKMSPKKKVSAKKMTKFGNDKQCYYTLPYFGSLVPNISKTLSGTTNSGLTSNAWMWPTPPGAKSIDMQQGGWKKY